MATLAATKASESDSLANIPDNISVKYLPDQAKLSGKVLEKGLNYFLQGYIHDIKVLEEESICHVTARCWPSMRKNDKPHMLSVDVERDSIRYAYCSCKAGLSGHCSHVVGLIKSLQGLKLHNFTHVPDQQSCTSIPQQWNVPRGSKIKPVPVNHVIVARPREGRKRKPVLCQIDTQTKVPNVEPKDMLHLSNLKGTPLECRILPDIPTVSTPLGDVQIGSALSYQTRCLKQTPTISQECGNTSVLNAAPIDLPKEFTSLNDHTTCEDPTKIEIETRSQALSECWFKERAKRLTASNFGKVLYRKSSPSEQFLNSIFENKNIKAQSLEYGKRHEKPAKERYLEKYPSRHFHEVGFIINNEFSFLGATPDGKLCDTGMCGIVEIKCPFSARNMTISHACDEIRDFCLEKVDESCHLKTNHQYYAQVQGQLLITGCDFCEFIVYTQQDMHVERIKPDVPFMTVMLNKLAEFYQNHALPYISSKQ